MDEVVPYAVDVGIDHQRVNESKDQHDPERRVRVKEEESQEISEMKQARRSWDRVPARVREEPGSCRRTLYADGVGRGHNFLGNLPTIYFGGSATFGKRWLGTKERQLPSRRRQ